MADADEFDCGGEEQDASAAHAEVQFDEFPQDLVQEGDCKEKMPVRASFIPGLLTLSEVDLILRGRFKPPFEETSRSASGGCFSNLTSSGTKKVRNYITGIQMSRHLTIYWQRLGVRMNATSQIVIKRRIVEDVPPLAIEVKDVPEDELSFEPLVIFCVLL